MKLFLSALLLIAVAIPATADDVVILPGNTRYINNDNDDNGLRVYQTGDDNDGVRIFRDGDEDNVIDRRGLRDGTGLYNAYGGDFNDVCAGANRASEYRRCQRDAAKAQEKLIRRYND